MRDSSNSRCQAGVVSLKMWNGFPLPTLLRVNSVYVHSKNAAFRAWIAKETRTCCRALYSVLLYVILAKPGWKCGKYGFSHRRPKAKMTSVRRLVQNRYSCIKRGCSGHLLTPEFYPNPTECREDRQNLVDSFKKNAALTVPVFTKLTPTFQSLIEDRLYSFPPRSAEKCRQSG
jgi:hypothetical protein